MAIPSVGKSDPPRSDQATLRFLAGWREIQEGAIRRGGKLLIQYDPEKLPHCRVNFRGAEFWDIEVNVRFHPGEQMHCASVFDRIREPPGRGMVIALVPTLVE